MNMTDELVEALDDIDQITFLVADGKSVRHACKEVGLSVSTYYRAIRKRKEDDGISLETIQDTYDKVTKAHEHVMLKIVDLAMVATDTKDLLTYEARLAQMSDRLAKILNLTGKDRQPEDTDAAAKYLENLANKAGPVLRIGKAVITQRSTTFEYTEGENAPIGEILEGKLSNLEDTDTNEIK